MLIDVPVVERGGSVQLLEHCGRENLFGRAHARFAFAQAQYKIGVAIHDAEVVRDQEDRHALLL